MTQQERQNLRNGLLFISPWVVGFLAFALYPLLASVYYSFTDYSVLSPPVWIGTENYEELADDPLFWKSMTNTLFFAALSIPLSTVCACALAIMLNFRIRFQSIFRTIFFLPALVPMVCLGVIWMWMLNKQMGLVNLGLSPVLGDSVPNWLEDPAFTKLGLVIATLWCLGHSMVIYLAGLQEAPVQLYEAAEIDGAGFWRKISTVTLPCLSPYIFFNTIMAIIGSFQTFAVPWVMMKGEAGPEQSMLFVATYIYINAFDNWQMGKACAVALILFIMIAILTLSVVKLGERKVHYQ